MISVVHNGTPITDQKRSLKDHGIRDGDLILLAQKPAEGSQGPPNPIAALDFGDIRVPARGQGGEEVSPGSRRAGLRQSAGQAPPLSLGDLLGAPERVRELIQAHPELLNTLKKQNPPLAAALESGDIGRFQEILRQQQERMEEVQRMRIRAANDPMDVEAQQFLENEIHQQNIADALDLAMEHTPENFAAVTMLYIDCAVNGHPIKAFVDSGAQTTIMSAGCAARCNIMRLVDKRFSGIAKGVGTQKIIGRIHSASLKIEADHLPVGFTVLEDQSMDMLLGLDMLKRHQCIIDLKRNVLHIGTTGSETSFLPESELPAHARGNAEPSQEDMDRDMQEAIRRSTDHNPPTHNGETSGGASQSVALPEGVRDVGVRELEAMGFNRGQVISELHKAHGDRDAALAALIAKSLHVPPKQ